MPGAPTWAQSENQCGSVISVPTHDGTTTAYSLSDQTDNTAFALILLPGGGGSLELDANGCPRRLRGNSLNRMRPEFHKRGFVTALVDAPSDHQGGDGLGGFRNNDRHAQDIGTVIADLRKRTRLPVWLVGTSRGTISAANAASQLKSRSAPDGVILTSPVTRGREGGYKAWVAQTVFSTDLSKIRAPLLVVAHAEDKCIRTPPEEAERIADDANGAREQTVLVTGGPGWRGPVGVKACRGKAPHGFFKQDTALADGIARFIRGGKY